MKVGWLQDDHGYVGGAEITATEFRAAAPKDVEIVPCPPRGIVPDCDVYLAHNAVQYSAEELSALEGSRVVKYAHDLVLHDFHGSRDWLRENAEWIFCSPAQRDRMGLDGPCIPPALDLSQFSPDKYHKGTCSAAQWRNEGKGARLLSEWARENGRVEVYGPGPFLPTGPNAVYCGEFPVGGSGEVLRRYKRFVFLPFDFEPFCRTVVEAHYSGCEVITNDLIGARYYLEEDPDALESAAEDFWAVLR